MNTNLAVVEYDNKRVLTSNQLAEAYETNSKVISYNFNNNKERYVEGKHYFALEGDNKREFINRLEIHDSSKNAKTIYLWTQNGTLLHAKSLNTDKAWEVYQNLVDFYFNVRDNQNKNSIPGSNNLTFMEATVNELKLHDQRIKEIDCSSQQLAYEVENISNSYDKLHKRFISFKDNMSEALRDANDRFTEQESATIALTDSVADLEAFKYITLDRIEKIEEAANRQLIYPQIHVNPIKMKRQFIINDIHKKIEDKYQNKIPEILVMFEDGIEELINMRICDIKKIALSPNIVKGKSGIGQYVTKENIMHNLCEEFMNAHSGKKITYTDYSERGKYIYE